MIFFLSTSKKCNGVSAPPSSPRAPPTGLLPRPRRETPRSLCKTAAQDRSERPKRGAAAFERPQRAASLREATARTPCGAGADVPACRRALVLCACLDTRASVFCASKRSGAMPGAHPSRRLPARRRASTRTQARAERHDCCCCCCCGCCCCCCCCCCYCVCVPGPTRRGRLLPARGAPRQLDTRDSWRVCVCVRARGCACIHACARARAWVRPDQDRAGRIRRG